MKQFFKFIFVLAIALFASVQNAAATDDGGASNSLTTQHALILGLVEGVTEYLPVSSTGHLFLAQRFMGIGDSGPEKDAADSYAICIQAGAILAVLMLYFGRVRSIVRGVFGRDDRGRRIAINLSLAFLPTALTGIAFENIIKTYLFGIWPITVAWFVGGIAILLMASRKNNPQCGYSIDDLSKRQAFLIGAAQCIAMWPGVSRSLVTILGGVLVGLNLSGAVEFSFLLGLVTLSAATVFEGLQYGGQIIAVFGWLNPLVGMAVAFVSAAIAVKTMVAFLNRNAMVWFGIYRVILSAAVLAAIITGRI